jgi:hypothetical protein
MTDLEKQLQASLPGRPTEVQDYAALHVVRHQFEEAVRLIRSARSASAVVLGANRKVVIHAADAELEVSRALIDIERAIRAHPAGRQR